LIARENFSAVWEINFVIKQGEKHTFTYQLKYVNFKTFEKEKQLKQK